MYVCLCVCAVYVCMYVFCVCNGVCVSGYMVFEMACGYELVTLTPSVRDLKAVRYPTVVEVSVGRENGEGGGGEW